MKICFSTPRSRAVYIGLTLVMALVASGIAYGLAGSVFQRATLNADENSYLFQAHNFLSGRIAQPFPPNFTAFRHKMIIVSPAVGWLSRYPFAHSLFLAPGVLMGDPYLIVALAAGLSLLLVTGAATALRGRVAGVTAGALLLLSPFFYFYHGTLLSHSSGMLATALLLWSYIRWRTTKVRGFALLAGFAWAFFLNNRTYTALLVALPFGWDALLALHRERTREQLLGTVSFALAALSGMLALLLYNRLSVGSFGTMTYLFYNPTENLGFGPRIYGRVDHTLARGLSNVWSNVQLLNVWLFGFWGSGLLGLALVLWGWTRDWTRLCLLATLAVVLGYAYFWYIGPRDAGPSYYFELLPFIMVGAALGVERLIRRITVWPVFVAAVIMLCFGMRLSLDTASTLRAFNEPRRLVLDALDEAPPRSLVFINPEWHRAAFAVGNDMIFNPRGLHSDPVVAHWMPTAHRAMVRYFADRTPYVLRPGEDGRLDLVPAPEPEEPLTLVFPIGPLGMHTGMNAIDEDTQRRTRVAFEPEHAPGLVVFGRYHFLHPGRYRMSFEVTVEGGEDADAPLRLEVAGDFARTLVATREIGSTPRGTVVPVEFEIDEFLLVEPRAWFSGKGRIEIVDIRLEELE